MDRQRFFFRLACGLGALGVILGAFGAHGLKGYVLKTYGEVRGPELLAIFETGAKYHLIHAVALLALSEAGDRLNLWADGNLRKTTLAAWLWTGGIVLFSGSLYVLAATNRPWLGMITPFGGLAFMAGWLLLPFAARRSAAS